MRFVVNCCITFSSSPYLSRLEKDSHWSRPIVMTHHILSGIKMPFWRFLCLLDGYCTIAYQRRTICFSVKFFCLNLNMCSSGCGVEENVNFFFFFFVIFMVTFGFSFCNDYVFIHQVQSIFLSTSLNLEV